MSLITTIENLRRESAALEPDALARRELQKAILEVTEQFLEELPDAPAYQQDHRTIAKLQQPFDEEGAEVQVVADLVRTSVDQTGINPASGNHVGYIPGGGIYTSSLADYWVDITNRYAGIFFANPGAVKMENELIRWMAQMLGYPETAWGNLASGGSIANLTAVVTARDARKITSDSIAKSVVYVTSQTHHCIAKAIRIAGLGSCKIAQVPLNEDLHMSIVDLQRMIEEDLAKGRIPFMVVSSAGTTDAGVIDPLEEISNLSKEYNIWHHVDAAYGGFFLLVEDFREKLSGISSADSVVLDPHKSLFLPYGLGIVMVRNGEHLKEAFRYEANYMQDAREIPEEVSPADVSIELTKHFRGLRLWLPLRIHGLRAFRAALHEKHLLACYFFEQISEITGFLAFSKPELSVVMFRHEQGNAFNQHLTKRIHERGKVFLSSTMIGDTYWLRVAVLVFRTHKQNIDLVLSELKACTSEIRGEDHSLSS